MDFPNLFSGSTMQSTVVITGLLAFAGYLVTYLGNRVMARRTARLQLVDRRLNEFYGPLYVASRAGNIAYRSLLAKQGKIQCHPIAPHEMKEWMLWMNTVFMPLNDIRERIIIEKAHLIVEEEMPRCLLDFVTHVVGYKAVLAKWADGDFSETRSTIGWPPEFDRYVERSYAALKAEQMRLLHSSAYRLYRRLGRKSRVSSAKSPAPAFPQTARE
jgi:hypothetical protein